MGEPTPLKILVADDTPTNIMMLAAVAMRLGHEVVTAANGREALQRYRETQPDLVFMDIMMPELDGVSAVQAIRALPVEHWVPVVFYSALDTLDDIVRGLESGGDDYLVKPASVQLLRAKINGYAHILGMQRQLRSQAEELRLWRNEAEEQTRLAGHVMARIVEAAGLRDPMLRFMNIPADNFSGDLLCAARGPGDELYLLLADAMGHGLPAALTAMPLAQTFYGMTAKGFPLGSIVRELNRRLRTLLPADRFVAATLAYVDVRGQAVEIWNGGNPDACLINSAGQVTRRYSSQHLPLGVLSDEQFSPATQAISIQESMDLLVCSDGLVEARSPAGLELGMAGIVDLFAAAPRETRQLQLCTGLEAHLAGAGAHDDISWMLVHIPLEKRHTPRAAQAVQAHREAISDWRLALSYGPEELRYLDVVPAVLAMLTQLRALQAHQGALFLILSELYNNALDHGLLRLDSSAKTLEDGFEAYLVQRAARLAALSSGQLDMSFYLHQEGDEAVLDITLMDSGPCFDHAAHTGDAGLASRSPGHPKGDLAPSVAVAASAALRMGPAPGGCVAGGSDRGAEPGAQLSETQRLHGRGIALVRSLCQDVVYSGNGNKVWARYRL